MLTARWQLDFFIVVVLFARCQHCLDNGLALTPPLGWITTERFECLVDCANYPDDCISEKLIKTTADTIVKYGLRDVGFRYLIIGDCWMNETRDRHGNLEADPDRFPDGIKALAQYVHDRGLLLGLEIDLSNVSCNGRPGSYGNYNRDASTLASWGVDYVKATACSFKNIDKLEGAYPSMGTALNKTRRHMVYDCNWPIEIQKYGKQPDYSLISKTCNIFSTSQLMADSWESLEKTIKHFSSLSRDLVNYTHPGSWSFPNPILVGDYGLSYSEQAMQLAVWSIMNAPLLVSADLRKINDYQRALLLNKVTLTVDQDVSYQMGTEAILNRLLLQTGQVHIWRKSIQPEGSFALALMYFNISGGPTRVSVILRDLGVHGSEWYKLTNILTGQQIGMYKSWYTFNCEVNPVGVLFVRAEAIR
ncbi:hypothetical protein LSH36_701g00031 [Paralvinella palmiformis]|uniref:Alpha-galactosidase n=1 Tax=Paralvinella palmiformis TaxID=53620 RepID=A0AAD9J344_9ANNE|nr:hypothetical protein LSH36_701g00031 [Paralvinella palmiformis]